MLLLLSFFLPLSLSLFVLSLSLKARACALRGGASYHLQRLSMSSAIVLCALFIDTVSEAL